MDVWVFRGGAATIARQGLCGREEADGMDEGEGTVGDRMSSGNWLFNDPIHSGGKGALECASHLRQQDGHSSDGIARENGQLGQPEQDTVGEGNSSLNSKLINIVFFMEVTCLVQISHLDLSTLSSQVSSHVICFTAESVWHPLYPAEITAPGGRILPSPAHFVAEKAIKWVQMEVGWGTISIDLQVLLDEKVGCWVYHGGQEQSRVLATTAWGSFDYLETAHFSLIFPPEYSSIELIWVSINKSIYY